MQIGQKYLLTTNDWFFAPDGESYKAVFGTVHFIVDSKEALGIATNRNSTNWYVVIGDMIIAGCQVFYAVRTNAYSIKPPTAESEHEGKRIISSCALSRIYDADDSGRIGGQ